MCSPGRNGRLLLLLVVSGVILSLLYSRTSFDIRRLSSVYSVSRAPNRGVGEVVPRFCADYDCIRLRDQLENWPEGKPKAFAYYLVQSDRVALFLRSLKSFDLHFNDVHHYPLVVYHEDLSVSSLNLIRSSSKSDIYFQTVRFEVPDFLPRNLTQLSCPWNIGYRHMCRFHAMLVYNQPIIDGFEYVWRLDDDSNILQTINYDIFEYMERNGLQYGYISIQWEYPPCVVNLWKSAVDYINRLSISPTFFSQWRRNKIYYNNFEVSRLSLWLSDDYQNYIDYIDRLGGIYYHRWGDAPIKTIAVSIFLPRNETHQFKDIVYSHKGVEIERFANSS